MELKLSDGSVHSLELKGTACSDIIAIVDVSYVLQGNSKTLNVEVPLCGGAQILEGSLSLNKEYFTLKELRTDLSKKSAMIIIDLNERIPYGYFLESIVVRNGSSDFVERYIQVKGIVHNLVEADPSLITLGKIELHSRVEGRLFVFSPYQRPLEIVRIVDENDREICFTAKNTTPHELDVVFTLEVPQEPTSSVLKKVLTVGCLVDGQNEEVTVEVYGFL